MMLQAKQKEILGSVSSVNTGRPSLSRTVSRGLTLSRETAQAIHVKLWLVHLLLSPLPASISLRIRANMYRLIGFRIGQRVAILGNITFDAGSNPYPMLAIGDDCLINKPFHVNLSAPVTIGNRVGVGHHTMIITDGRTIGTPTRRWGKKACAPVTIEDGVWMCARSTILPGVTVGRSSVIAAGAVVTKDVPPNTLVAGVPARVVKYLPEGPTTDTNVTGVCVRE